MTRTAVLPHTTTNSAASGRGGSLILSINGGSSSPHTLQSLEEQQQRPSSRSGAGGDERTRSTRHTLATVERHNSSKSDYSKQVVQDEKTTVVNRTHTERYGKTEEAAAGSASTVQIISSSGNDDDSMRKKQQQNRFEQQRDYSLNNDDEIRSSSRNEQHYADISSSKSLSSGMTINQQQQQQTQKRSRSSAAQKLDREWSMSELKADNDNDYRHSNNTLLDTSIQRARAEVAHSGTMAQRRPPSRHRAEHSQSSTSQAAATSSSHTKSEATLHTVSNAAATTAQSNMGMSNGWKSDDLHQQQLPSHNTAALRFQQQQQQQKTIHHIIGTTPSPVSPSPRFVELPNNNNNSTMSSSASSTQRYTASRNEDNSTVIVVPPVSPVNGRTSSNRGGIVTSPTSANTDQLPYHTIAVGTEQQNQQQQKSITLGTRTEQAQIQQSDDVHNYGFTRITKSDGGSGRRAHERFTYAQQDDRQHEVTISYGTPAAGMQQVKYVVERDDVLLNQEAHVQPPPPPPEEKIRFREEMTIPQKEISVTFGVDEKKFKPPPPLPNKVPLPPRRPQSAAQMTTSQQQHYAMKATSNTISVGESPPKPAPPPPPIQNQKVIKFNETRQKTMGEVSVLVGVNAPAPVPPRRPVPTTTTQQQNVHTNERFNFSETIELPPKEVSLTFGVQPPPQPAPPRRVVQREEQRVDLQEKVTFNDERTIPPEKVAVVFGIQQPPSPPPPVPLPPPIRQTPVKEKFVFHDNVQVAQKDVSIKFAIEQPPSPPQSPAVPQVSLRQQRAVSSGLLEHQQQHQIQYGKIESFKVQSLVLSDETEDEQSNTTQQRILTSSYSDAQTTFSEQTRVPVRQSFEQQQKLEQNVAFEEAKQKIDTVTEENRLVNELKRAETSDNFENTISSENLIQSDKTEIDSKPVVKDARSIFQRLVKQTDQEVTLLKRTLKSPKPRIEFGKVESKAASEQETTQTISQAPASVEKAEKVGTSFIAEESTTVDTFRQRVAASRARSPKPAIVFGKVESKLRQSFVGATEVAQQSTQAAASMVTNDENETASTDVTATTIKQRATRSTISPEALTETLENILPITTNESFASANAKQIQQRLQRIKIGKVESVESEGTSYGETSTESTTTWDEKMEVIENQQRGLVESVRAPSIERAMKQRKVEEQSVVATQQKRRIKLGKVQSIESESPSYAKTSTESSTSSDERTKIIESHHRIETATAPSIERAIKHKVEEQSVVATTQQKQRIKLGKVQSIESESSSYAQTSTTSSEETMMKIVETQQHFEAVPAPSTKRAVEEKFEEAQLTVTELHAAGAAPPPYRSKPEQPQHIALDRVESSKTAETLQQSVQEQQHYEVTLPVSPPPPVASKTLVLERIRNFAKQQQQQQQLQQIQHQRPLPRPKPRPPPRTAELHETINAPLAIADVVQPVPATTPFTYDQTVPENHANEQLMVVQSTSSARRRENITKDHTESEGESTDERMDDSETRIPLPARPSRRRQPPPPPPPPPPPTHERRERLERSSSSSSGSDENETIIKSSRQREDVKTAREEILAEKPLEVTAKIPRFERGMFSERTTTETVQKFELHETLLPHRIRRESMQKSSSSSEGSDDNETVIKLSRKKQRIPPSPLPVLEVPVTSYFQPEAESTSFMPSPSEVTPTTTLHENVHCYATTEMFSSVSPPQPTIRRSSLTEEHVEAAVPLEIREEVPQIASSSQRSQHTALSYELNTISTQTLPTRPPPPPPAPPASAVRQEEREKFSSEVLKTSREEQRPAIVEAIKPPDTTTKLKLSEQFTKLLQHQQQQISVTQLPPPPQESVENVQQRTLTTEDLKQHQAEHVKEIQKQRFLSELITTPSANLNGSRSSVLSGFEYNSPVSDEQQRPQSDMRVSSGFDYISSVEERRVTPRLRYRSGSTYEALVSELQPNKRTRVRSGFEYRAPSEERLSSNKVRRLSGSSYSAEAEHITFQRSKMTAGFSYQAASTDVQNVFQMKPSRSVSGYLYQATVNDELHEPPRPPPLQLGKMESKQRERTPPPSPIPSPISVSPPRQPSPPPKPRVRTELEMRSNPDDLLCAQGKYGFAYAADAEPSGRRSRTLSGFEYGAPVGEQPPKHPRGIYGYDYNAPVGDELKLRNPRDIYGFTYRAMVEPNAPPRPLTPPAPTGTTRIQSDPQERKRARSSPPPERRPIEFHIKEQINYNKRIHTEEVYKLRSETTTPTPVMLPTPPPPPPRPPSPPREPTPPPMEYSTIEHHLYHELSSDTIKKYVEPPPPPTPLPPPPPEPPAITEHRYRIETIKRYELPVNENDGTVPDLDSVNPTAVRQVIRRLVNGEWKDVAANELSMLGNAAPPGAYQPRSLPTIEEQSAASHGGSSFPSSDEGSEYDDDEAVVEETTTTRRIRRVEETEELIGRR